MFEICRSKDGQYYTRLIGKNGACLMVSEMYTAKAGAKRVCTAVDKLWGGMLDVEVIDMTHTVTVYPKIQAIRVRR